MVSIGNEQFFVAHDLLDLLDNGRVMDAPHPMPHIVFIQHKHVRLGLGGQQLLDLRLGVAVKHENLPEMRLGVAEQLQPVFTGLGMGLLVPEDHLVGVVMHLSQCNEAAPLGHVMVAGSRECLGIEVYRRFRVLFQDAACPPVMQVFGCTGIDVEPRTIGLPGAPQDDADQVMLAQFVVLVLHLRGNLVIGLRDHVPNANLVRVVTKCFEGDYLCHVREPCYSASSLRYLKWMWRTRRPSPSRLPELPKFVIAIISYSGKICLCWRSFSSGGHLYGNRGDSSGNPVLLSLNILFPCGSATLAILSSRKENLIVRFQHLMRCKNLRKDERQSAVCQ